EGGLLEEGLAESLDHRAHRDEQNAECGRAHSPSAAASLIGACSCRRTGSRPASSAGQAFAGTCAGVARLVWLTHHTPATTTTMPTTCSGAMRSPSSSTDRTLTVT